MENARRTAGVSFLLPAILRQAFLHAVSPSIALAGADAPGQARIEITSSIATIAVTSMLMTMKMAKPSSVRNADFQRG